MHESRKNLITCACFNVFMHILTSISLLLLEADLLLTSKAFPDSNFMELTGIIKILNSNFVDLLFVTIVDAATLHLE